MTGGAPAPPDDHRVVMDGRIAQRRAQVRQDRVRRRRRTLWAVLALIVLLTVAVAVARSPLFAISEVRVHGVSGVQADQARDAAGIHTGDNLLAAPTDDAQTAVTALPWVAGTDVTRSLPSTLEILVTPREPVAAVHLADGSWLVDAEGIVLGEADSGDLVGIDAPDSALPAPGEPLEDPAVADALALHTALPSEVAGRVHGYETAGPGSLRARVEADDGQLVRLRLGSAEQAELKGEVALALLGQASDVLEDPGGVEIDVRAPENPVLVPADGQ